MAPDNGLLSMVLRYSKGVTCYRVENTHYFNLPVSDTFHARDIFGPVAAYLGLGAEPSSFGPPHPNPVRFSWPKSVVKDHCIEGEVIYIDGFGNLISNISADIVRPHDNADKEMKVHVKGMELPLLRTYSDVTEDMPLALMGSSGFIELAVNQGSASEILGIGLGERIVIWW